MITSEKNYFIYFTYNFYVKVGVIEVFSLLLTSIEEANGID